MDRPYQTRQRRKLTKSQVIELLERNVALYRNEESFVHYLVELGIYLLEYEYDWNESGDAPPPNLRPRPEDTPVPGSTTNHNGKFISRPINPASNHPLSRKVCPFCGTETNEAYVCPKCRNVTR